MAAIHLVNDVGGCKMVAQNPSTAIVPYRRIAEVQTVPIRTMQASDISATINSVDTIVKRR